MNQRPATVMIGIVDDWWERVRYSSPHDPETEAERERRQAALKSRVKVKPKSFEQRLRERQQKKRIA